MDGLKNSSEMLQMTVTQLQQYRQLEGFSFGDYRGEQPRPVYYGVTMKTAAAQIDAKYVANVENTLQQIENENIPLKEALKNQGNKYLGGLNDAHFKNQLTGQRYRNSVGLWWCKICMEAN